jgi:hypothetical protein
MYERRLDERGAPAARGALGRADPLARERVDDLGVADRVGKIAVTHERRRQQAVDRRSEPAAANR